MVNIILKRYVLTFIVGVFLLTKPVSAGEFVNKNNPLKILTEKDVLIVNDNAYINGKNVYVPYNKVKNKTTRKNTLKIKNKDYINIKNTKYKYNKTYNVIYLGKSLTSDEVLNTIIKKKKYTKSDYTWLSKLVYAEARGENYMSQLGVANVVINRKKSSQYPNTIKGVVMDKKNGVQFSTSTNGAINNKSNKSCKLVALNAICGVDNSKKALFFMNPKIAKSSWIAKNRNFAVRYGNHNFYY